jgi:HEPN domain-containing protein
MKEPLDHALELLTLADEDLASATALIGGPNTLRPACFHAQQAAEKALKALLAADDVVYPWTHDIGVLLNLAGSRAPGLNAYREALAGLSQYGVEIRYNIAVSPSPEEARAALEAACAVVSLVRARIPSCS